VQTQSPCIRKRKSKSVVESVHHSHVPRVRVQVDAGGEGRDKRTRGDMTSGGG
jgi:hypothetical protein